MTRTTPPPLTLESALAALRSQANPHNTAGMARYGINVSQALGVPMPFVRELARGQHNHTLALELWDSGIHEARILASLVDVPAQVTRKQMDAWAADFDSWDVCDQVCSNLFDRTPYTLDCIYAWAERPEEYVRRAAFTLIAALAMHDRHLPDEVFLDLLALIERSADDPRNFVKKAVNWALRGIGKRKNRPALAAAALQTARRLRASASPAARWVGTDAARELENKFPHLAEKNP